MKHSAYSIFVKQGSFHGKTAKVNVVQFADDFTITGAAKELLEQDILPLVERFFAERGLHLSPTKTVIMRIEDGFDVLRQTIIRTYEGKLLITPSRKSVQSLLTEVRAIIQANKQAITGHLIFLLNPLIRRWAEYQQSGLSQGGFCHFSCLVAMGDTPASHERKRVGHAQVFSTHSGATVAFPGISDARGQPPHLVRLLQASSVSIRRHTKIRSDAHPYDRA